MKSNFRKIILVGLLVLFPTLLFGGEVHDYVTFWDYTNVSEQITWDPIVNNAECVGPQDPKECCTGPATGNCLDVPQYYKLKIWHKEHDREYARGKVDHPGNIATTTFPRTGHYIVMITSCITEGDPPVERCAENCDSGDPPICVTDWCESIDANCSMVDLAGDGTYEERAWWVFRQLAPPGGIE
jgi:hypothetical protein